MFLRGGLRVRKQERTDESGQIIAGVLLLHSTALYDFKLQLSTIVRLRLLTSTPKPSQQAKPFAAVAQCTAKKGPGNPDKDLGNFS